MNKILLTTSLLLLPMAGFAGSYDPAVEDAPVDQAFFVGQCEMVQASNGNYFYRKDVSCQFGPPFEPMKTDNGKPNPFVETPGGDLPGS